MKASERIIVALDDMNAAKALDVAEKLANDKPVFKVNTLLREKGYGLIQELASIGRVMADLKLHDIPNTVKNDAMALAKIKPKHTGEEFGDSPRHPVFSVTLMATGGIEMMRGAVSVLSQEFIGAWAVTVLTSATEEETNLLYGRSSKAVVLQLARNAVLAGMSGIVCSPQELSVLQKPEFKNLTKITPGIRPKWHQKPDDQNRVMTPADAIRAGADYLVIGRPITQSSDIRGAFYETVEEVGVALGEMKSQTSSTT